MKEVLVSVLLMIRGWAMSTTHMLSIFRSSKDKKRNSTKKIFHRHLSQQKNDQFDCHSCNREYDKQRITTQNQHIKGQVMIKKKEFNEEKSFTAIFHNKNDHSACH